MIDSNILTTEDVRLIINTMMVTFLKYKSDTSFIE